MNGNTPHNRQSIVSIIAVGVAIAMLILFIITHPPTYEVTISPFSGEINPGEEINSTIVIQKTWILPLPLEKKPVKLAIDSTQTEGIVVKFFPSEGIPVPFFSSKIVISVSPNATHCSRPIPIIISDGKQTTNVASYILLIGRGEYGDISVLPTQSGTNSEAFVPMSDYYYPSGWMGDTESIEYFPVSTNVTSHSGNWNIELKYSPKSTDPNGWSGINWQYPDNNWGNLPGGYDLSGYSRLTFWARGKNGGERAEFKVGGLSTGKYPDSLQPAATTQPFTLTNEWTKYTIDLTGKNLHRIGGGFVWVANRESNPEGCTIYLDDIRFEK